MHRTDTHNKVEQKFVYINLNTESKTSRCQGREALLYRERENGWYQVRRVEFFFKIGEKNMFIC